MINNSDFQYNGFKNWSKLRILAILNISSGLVWYDAEGLRRSLSLYFHYNPSKNNLYDLMRRYKIQKIVKERTGVIRRKEWKISMKGIKRLLYLFGQEWILFNNLIQKFLNKNLMPEDCIKLSKRISNSYWEDLCTLYELLGKANYMESIELETLKSQMRKIDKNTWKNLCDWTEFSISKMTNRD